MKVEKNNNSLSALQESEKDNIEFAKLILEIPLTTDEMKATALNMLKDMQAIKRSRLENLQNRAESFSTPFFSPHHFDHIYALLLHLA